MKQEETFELRRIERAEEGEGRRSRDKKIRKGEGRIESGGEGKSTRRRRDAMAERRDARDNLNEDAVKRKMGRKT